MQEFVLGLLLVLIAHTRPPQPPSITNVQISFLPPLPSPKNNNARVRKSPDISFLNTLFHQGGHECKGGHCQIGLGGQRAQDGQGGLNAKNSEQVTSLFWNESSREESEDLELRVSRVIRTIGIKSSN